MIVSDISKVFIPATTAFVLGIALAPLLTHYLFKYKVWKKKAHKATLYESEFNYEKALGREPGLETKTPRMGGILIWATVAIVTLLCFALARTLPFPFFEKLDFLSRSQTWIPLFTLLAGAIVGFINDLLDLSPAGEKGMSIRTRLLFVTLVALFIGSWFYGKLGVVSVGLPSGGELYLGVLIVPLFILITLGLYAGGVIDGIDGLSGGVFAAAFTAYAGIAYFQNQINLAAFCATLVGGILAFLWFNIPPARFWMTETGTMGITMTLAVVAFMTDAKLGGGYGIAALPVIAFPLVVTVLSNVIQVFSWKFRHKPVFRIAPLHHHFEAIGWPAYKVTMRYWVVSVVCAIAGMTLALLK